MSEFYFLKEYFSAISHLRQEGTLHALFLNRIYRHVEQIFLLETNDSGVTGCNSFILFLLFPAIRSITFHDFNTILTELSPHNILFLSGQFQRESPPLCMKAVIKSA